MQDPSHPIVVVMGTTTETLPVEEFDEAEKAEKADVPVGADDRGVVVPKMLHEDEDARVTETSTEAVTTPVATNEPRKKTLVQKIFGRRHTATTTVDIERGLIWSGVTMQVDTPKGTKTILDNCSGSCYPGQVSCIIGPSGAGKTSLFEALNGKRMNQLLPGSHITLDGRVLTRDLARTEVAFVPQEESIFSTVTPREAMIFSARLRLPSSTTNETISKMVDAMLVRLSLTSCADTLIGDQIIRGISGGEKKRTAIGVELITQPTTLFLDEPTSGLDSFAALEIVKLLRKLADEGCTVLTVIHQPSSEIFSKFDRVFLVSKGRIMYGGDSMMMLEHFETLGHVCPMRYNPADFVLFLMQTENEESLAKIQSAWASSELKNQGAPELKPAAIELAAARINAGADSRKPGFTTQLIALVKREAQGVIRNKPALIARFGITAFLNLFFALIFWKVGSGSTDCPGPDCIPNIQNHFGAIVNIAISLMFGSANAILLAFPLERPTFLREYGTATYGTLPYFISKTLVEIVVAFAQTSVAIVIGFWIMDLQGSIIVLIFSGLALALVSNSFALLLGCGLSNIQSALEMTPLVFVPQIMFSGIFIRLEAIPEFLRWAQYLCSLKWTVNIMAITEFSVSACEPPSKFYNSTNEASVRAVWEAECIRFLDRQDMSRDDWGLYVGILVAMFFIARTAAALLLQSKAI